MELKTYVPIVKTNLPLSKGDSIFLCLADIFCYPRYYSDAFVQPSRNALCTEYQQHKIA